MRRKIRTLLLSLTLLALIFTVYQYEQWKQTRIGTAQETSNEQTISDNDSSSFAKEEEPKVDVLRVVQDFFTRFFANDSTRQNKNNKEPASTREPSYLAEHSKEPANQAPGGPLPGTYPYQGNETTANTNSQTTSNSNSNSNPSSSEGRYIAWQPSQQDSIRNIFVSHTVEGVTFREVDDIIYAAKAAKLYLSPNFEGGAVGTAGAWEAFHRVGISKDCCYQLIDNKGRIVYADGLYFRRNKENFDFNWSATSIQERVELDVKQINQKPTLPTGCEITSLAIVLNYLGYDVTKEKLADDYLPKAPVGEANFYEEFVGNPRDENAYGCYKGAIIKTANSYIGDVKGTHQVYDFTGSDMNDLFAEVRQGNPVILWNSAYISEEPRFTTEWIVDGEYIIWKGNQHCVVLIGYDTLEKKVIVADPIWGKKEYDMDMFVKRYIQYYSQAIVIK